MQCKDHRTFWELFFHFVFFFFFDFCVNEFCPFCYCPHSFTHTPSFPICAKWICFQSVVPSELRSAPRKYWQNIFVQYYCSRSFYLKCTQTKGKKKLKLLYLLRFDKCDPMTINSCSWRNTNEFFFLKWVFPSKHNWDVTVKLFYNKCTLFLSNLMFDHFRLSTKIILLVKNNPFYFKISQKKLFVDNYYGD